MPGFTAERCRIYDTVLPKRIEDMIEKRFLRFYYAAIKRYGDKRWTAHGDECIRKVAKNINKLNQY